MDRDCNNCIHHTTGSCSKFNCDLVTVSDVWNKAIDDFAEKMNAKCDGIIKEKWNSNVAPISWAEAYADFKDDIDEIAEQLKAGDNSWVIRI